MKLALVSQSATGRNDRRASALVEALEGTRITFMCGRMMSGPRSSTPAGLQIHNLMKVMVGTPFVEGSEFMELRDTSDPDAVARAIRVHGLLLNSFPHPTDPQGTSLVVVADPQFLRRLAVSLGGEFDPTQLYTLLEVALPALEDIR